MPWLEHSSFQWIDWLIVILYLTGSLGLGILVAKKVKTMTDFVCAGRTIGLFLGIASLAGTEMGLITIMYSAQKGFSGGFAAFHIALVAGFVCLLVGLTGFIVGPLREQKVLTIPEFYEKRFGSDVRILGAIMLALGGILNMGLFLKVGAMFLVGITGSFSEWMPIILTGLLIVVLFYTCLGGMYSVIITDFIQFCVIALGLLMVVGFILSQVGLELMFETVLAKKGIAGFDPLAQNSTFGPLYVLWMLFTAGLVSCAIWPTAVARALAMKSVQLVKRQYVFSSILFMIRFLIPYFIGIAAFVYFVSDAPALNQAFLNQELSSLYALPLFLKELLPVGLLGFFSAAMIAAFMSTHDGYLLCFSTVITQDIVAPLLKRPLSEKTRIVLTRIIIVIIGIYIWYWGLIYKGVDDVWDYMAITGAIYFTGAFSVLVGGLYWKKASKMGARLALYAGFSALLGLGPIRHTLGLSHLTGAQIGLATVLFSLTMMVLGSLAFPDKKEAYL